MIKKLTVIFICFAISGCAGGYVYGKRTKGRLEPVEEYRKGAYALNPVSQIIEKGKITINVEYIPEEDLKTMFLDRQIYGAYAYKNPYPAVIIVIKVKIENQSDSRIYINPDDFVMIDELGTQYMYISPERIKSIYESRGSVSNLIKSTSSLAPGIYGAPLGMAHGLAGRGLERRYALLKSVELNGGYVYPGVTYEGFLAFLKPNPKAKNIKLVLSNIKTSFDVNDEALGRVDFIFEFESD
ncbi:MAG: hypothetical protein PHQ54_01350 [Candidatus Omnitrophica bacterium]|nr:hypothetical protein [Candidatus Omnitrophota bacterium]